jgi:hypothetical protein
MQAADFHLLSGPDTPLSLLTPSFVNTLTYQDLEDIAGEDAGVKRVRAQLKKEIRDLGAGKKIMF